MSVLDHLSAIPGVYWGEGRGPGGGRFVARIALRHHDDQSLTFDYEAWSPDGGLQHAESARLARTGATVTLAATSSGGDDTMIFREGEPGVFGSVGKQRVGLVITTDGPKLAFSWWWTGRDGTLKEQSRAVVSPMRQIVAAPAVPGAPTSQQAPAPRAAGASLSPASASPEPSAMRAGQLTASGSAAGGAPMITPTLTAGTSSDPADPGMTVLMPAHPAQRVAEPDEREDQAVAAEAARAAVSRHPAGRRRAPEGAVRGRIADIKRPAISYGISILFSLNI